MDVYGELLALTEREQRLVAAGAWEELAALDAERRELGARLAAAPPASAAETLARAAEIQACTTALLAAGVDALRRELGALAHGRTAVRGYGDGAAVAPAPRRLDLAG